jgi:hypothetical protein
VRVRDDLSSQQMFDATIRFLDLMRASKVTFIDPAEARTSALDSVEVFMKAIAAPDVERAA